MPIQSEHLGDGICLVKISNPGKRNALDMEMFESLARLWPELNMDPQVRCVVVTGGGAKAFCSGADLSAHMDRSLGMDDLIDAALLKTSLFDKPMIAAIEGACVAGGLELALAADIRIAALDAVLGLPEVRWGIVPSGGGAMKLCDQIGHAKAMDLLMTGRLITGREAQDIGLVTQACEPGSTIDLAMARARLIAANSPSALFATKHIALSRRASTYAAMEARERFMVAQVRDAGDPEEGKAAFLEKRVPVFGPVPDGLRRLASGPRTTNKGK